MTDPELRLTKAYLLLARRLPDATGLKRENIEIALKHFRKTAEKKLVDLDILATELSDWHPKAEEEKALFTDPNWELLMNSI